MVNLVRNRSIRRKVHDFVFLIATNLLNGIVSGCVTFHGEENRPKSGGLIVMNHTTPLDTSFFCSKTVNSIVSKKKFTFETQFYFKFIDRAASR